MIRIEGAAENNLRDVDVSFPGGITAVVGVSGSGKSSLALDTLYHESRRRFLETFSLGSPALRTRPARVRDIHGLTPAVAVGQNVLNRNPASTLATAAGVHPFLRVLYARFAERTCPRCGEVVTTASLDTQLAVLRALAARAESVEVAAPLARGAEGSHQRLLGHLTSRFPSGTVEVDGRRWSGGALDPDLAHDIAVHVATVGPADGVRRLREVLESVAALGTPQVTFRVDGTRRTLSRAPLCPRCAAHLPDPRPTDFRTDGGGAAAAHRLGGRTLPELLRLDVEAAAGALAGTDLPERAGRALEQVRLRLTALSRLGLGYLSLDRPSPTLSRGEAQRVRLAVILTNAVEDLLHVVDEPTIGLHPAQAARLMEELDALRGPVVLVEHDRWAVAACDHVVELGPGAGSGGGRVVFEGPPARLWAADTPSGRWFSARARLDPPAPRPPGREWLTVRGARLHNLVGFDCALPARRLTAVAGPSGAGKTTFVRDVLVASLAAGRPVGCAGIDGPGLRPVVIDQSPIGRNPRSTPATYTGLAERIRAVFAAATGAPGSVFSFNRSEGACPECDGMGAVEVKMAWLPPEWMTCETCQGRRFGDEALAASARLANGATATIAEVYDTTVAEAAALFDDARALRILRSLADVGLDYLQLGQPSPTLSGGEAQRVKLARELARAKPGQLVFLDEPTTGLHPANLTQLVTVLRSLVDRGCTVVVVEHNPDVLAAADWLVQIGPGGGPEGGRLLSAAPPPAAGDGEAPRPRAASRTASRGLDVIAVREATAHNLRGVSVELPKRAISAVVGVSGSGKSSLVRDVLEAEAMRRLLEGLSLYERQSVREGPEAQVGAVTGLGPTVAIGPERRFHNPRSTVGTATELSFHLGVVLAYAGARRCPRCGGGQRRTGPVQAATWRCAACGQEGPAAAPSDFSPATYAAACLRCHGLGTVAVPRVERLIVRPERPLCEGAMHSPGFFPQSYLCKPANGGYWMLQALARRHGFDPFVTPWREMSRDAQDAFLHGKEQVEVAPEASRMASRTVTWHGVFRIFAGWDAGGLYTERAACPACGGERLRPQFLDVAVEGMNRHALHHQPVADVAPALDRVQVPAGAPGWVARSLAVAGRRLRFLERVGLGYLHLDRLSASLSAGEAQRVKLASLLGSEMTGMTVLLDEPSRGMHPREVDSLGDALAELRGGGNTVVLVDHDPRLIDRADHLVVLGPGAGREGGAVVAAGPQARVRQEDGAARLLGGRVPPRARARRREPAAWMVVRQPTENNLSGEDVPIPLGVLAGICGVSGSGKSTLAIDILARALAPVRLTSSVASEAVDPGAHAGIDGAPARAIHADQRRAGIRSPGAFLGVLAPLRRAYAESAVAAALGLGEDDLTPSCDACKGQGSVRVDMGFLPSVEHPCDACDGTGYRAAAREVVVRGLSLPDLEGLTIAEVLERWGDREVIARPLRAASRLGLGYLALAQGAAVLSGGERQRLKLARELARPVSRPTLYILDEPTTGLHALDVERLVDALDGLVGQGHSVLVVDHDPALLACCDRLIELGPEGGPGGGRVVASGTPEELAGGGTATAPYLREVLG